MRLRKLLAPLLFLAAAATAALALTPGQRIVLLGGKSKTHNGIHLDFINKIYYTRAPGQSPVYGTFAGIFTVTNSNNSYYMGPNGLLVASQTNTARLEYDASGQPLGILVEGARTNLALWSNNLTQAGTWVLGATMTRAMTATGPDGVANSATTLTGGGVSATNTILQTITSASAQRTISAWVKRRTGSGTVNITVDNGVTWTAITLTPGWAKVSYTQAAVTNPVIGFQIITSGDAFDVYGVQLESAAFASSTIPTTTASVTRADDSITRVLGLEWPWTAAQTAGTISMKASVLATGAGPSYQCIADISDSSVPSNNEMIEIFLTTASGINPAGQVQTSGVNQTPNNTSQSIWSVTAGIPFRYAFAWSDKSGGTARSSLGLSSVVTDAGPIPVPSVTPKLWLGARHGLSLPAFGHVSNFDLYSTALPASQLAGIVAAP